MALAFSLIIGICISSFFNAGAFSAKTCDRDAEDYSSCLRLAIQETWPTVVRGMPELNVPVMDPFETEDQTYSFELGEVLGKIAVKNVKSYGLSKIRFLSVRPYHKENQFRLDVDFLMPKVLVEGDYKAEGTLGTFRIGGKGQFNISMENVRSILQLEGPIVNDRWIIEEFSLTPEVGNMKVWASDLFNGNAELTKAALDFSNEYWQILYQGMLPFASKTWNEGLKKLANQIFSKMSFSESFP